MKKQFVLLFLSFYVNILGCGLSPKVCDDYDYNLKVCDDYLLYNHSRKMKKDVHVLTHVWSPWSIDLIEGETYWFRRWQVYTFPCIPGTMEYIFGRDNKGRICWLDVYESDWLKATSDENSYEDNHPPFPI